MSAHSPQPVMLIVLDGFGIGDGGDSDAIALANHPFLARIAATYPMAQVETSGAAVGLPDGQMGNSEVGHMTMGAGRVIDQDLTRITKALTGGVAEASPAIKDLFTAVTASGGTLHLMGLLSDGGVHSHQDHLIAILQECGRRDIPATVHAILDGRDTPPRSALTFLDAILPAVDAAGATISTVTGRYFAMDRDNRWDRVAQAYTAIVDREGETAPDAAAAITTAYERDEDDEFVAPTCIDGGRPLLEGDAVWFFNFRADRAREITNALTAAAPELLPGADELDRSAVPELAGYLCMTEYDADFDLPVAFPSTTPAQILAEVVASAGLTQLRAAETEKYAHVTFFFNAGVEEPFPGEDRLLVPSPRDVDTYDHKPEMSAIEVTDRLLNKLRDESFDFVLVNYANPDMVGHTGVLDAAIKAVEVIDDCLERVCGAVLEAGGDVLITADHGNCELMRDPSTGQPHTAHTTNPVPLHWVSDHTDGRTLRNGGLADLAPTVLELLGLPQPAEMTGRSLLSGG
ncbi:MAG: 2,3-bisphosphoglycerate-independent phosphoglycerate mutase [Acidimicrobiales bacterium]|nr:2,3-bisphosphoglycerate-independent phosphoglycerate mutase [Acidimicrobiales bacterium]